MLRRDLTGRLAVTAVIAVDLIDRSRRLLDVLDREQPFPRRQHVREARVLRDHRLARGQVADAPLAEPPAPQPHLLVLGDGELAAGPLHVTAVLPRPDA